MSDRGFRLTHSRLLALAIFSLLVLLAGCKDTSDTWFGTLQFGVSGAQTYGKAITVHNYECITLCADVLVAGYTNGNLDGKALTGIEDAFVTMYEDNGSKLWTRLLGVSGAATYAYGVATDSNTNVYVAGATGGNLDGQTLTGIQDFYVTKYNQNGNKQWTRLLGASGAVTQANAVATDTSRNVYAAGLTNGNLDGKALTGTEDAFVTKYDSSGNKQWTELLGALGATTRANGVATDSSGNVYVAGYTNGNLDGKTLTGTTDFFVTKYDSSGNKQWTELLGASGADTEANAIAIADDGSNDFYVAGFTNGNLDGKTLTGTEDSFLTKYDSNGNKKWTRLLGVSFAYTGAYGVASFGYRVAVAGYTNGDLDGKTLMGIVGSFVTEYISNGNPAGTRLLGAEGANTFGTGVGYDMYGDVWMPGYTDGSLGSNTLTGIDDYFLTKYKG